MTGPLLGLWLLGACTSPREEPPPPTPAPRVEALHDKLRRHAEVGLGAPEQRQDGQNLEMRWSTEGARSMASGGSRRREVVLRAHPRDGEPAGLTYDARVDDPAGHRAWVQWVSDGHPEVASGVFIHLVTGDAADPWASFGLPLEYELGFETVFASERPTTEEAVAFLDAARAGPESLVRSAEDSLEALERAVSSALDGAGYSTCVLGQNPGYGQPRGCIFRAPTPEEVARDRARFEADVARWREILHAHPEVWSALLSELLPPLGAP